MRYPGCVRQRENGPYQNGSLTYDGVWNSDAQNRQGNEATGQPAGDCRAVESGNRTVGHWRREQSGTLLRCARGFLCGKSGRSTQRQELAPMWPALAIALGLQTRMMEAPSPRKLEFELHYAGA